MQGFERKLCVGMVVIALAFLPSLGFALYFLSAVTKAQETLGSRYARTLMLAQGLREYQLQQNALVPVYVLTGSETYVTGLDKATSAFDRTLKDLAAMPLPEASRKLLVAIGARQSELREVQGAGIAMRRGGANVAETDAHFHDKAGPLMEPMLGGLDGFVRQTYSAYEDARARNDGKFHLAFQVVSAACVLSVLSCCAALFLLVRLVGDKRAHDEVRERNAAREAEVSAARKDAVETVAHDLKNPLAAISMAASRLGRGPEKDARMAEVISSSSASMDLLIRNLLDQAKIEAGGLALSKSRTDVGAIIDGLSTRLSLLASGKGVEIVNAVPANLPPVLADPVRIEQVFSNILGNALKFTPRGGRVTLDHRMAGGALLVTVSDTGPGMSPEEVTKAFERYWQSGATAAKGTGLGLAISRAIVEAHGGEITVRSALRAGAAFTVSLPAPQATPLRGEPHPPGAIPVPHGRQGLLPGVA